jgi:hypothetical protein
MQAHRISLTYPYRRQLRHSSTSRVVRSPPVPISRRITTFATTRFERLFLWLRGHKTRHHGPKVPSPALFERKDLPFFALPSVVLQIKATPPGPYHDLLDAAAKVGVLEGRLGYTLSDKMMCIQALKTTGTHIPFYFDGKTYLVNRNNRFALLGDRVLSLAVCEMWFQTTWSPRK